MPIKITTKIIQGMTPPASGNIRIYDTELKGFGVRMTAKGAVAFILNYSAKGIERRVTIGSYPEWTVVAARERAKELRRQIDQGQDPLLARQQDRDAATVSDLWRTYQVEHLPTLAPRSQTDVKAMWRVWIIPTLGGRKVGDLLPKDIDSLHRKIAIKTPVRANRVIEVLRKALTIAERHAWVDRNVAHGFGRTREHSRNRYLDRAEIIRVLAAAEKITADNKAKVEKPGCKLHPNTHFASIVSLLLLTGARLNELLKARWEHFDIPGRTWNKPPALTKQRRRHTVPLGDTAMELIQGLPRRAGCPYLFP